MGQSGTCGPAPGTAQVERVQVVVYSARRVRAWYPEYPEKRRAYALGTCGGYFAKFPFYFLTSTRAT